MAFLWMMASFSETYECHSFHKIENQFFEAIYSGYYQDNVFVNVVASIQYRVVNQHAKEAFYKLSRPQEQIQAYVFDG